MMKIAIAGLGGVGGFFGAKLAQAFGDTKQAEIYFFARGQHLDKIREHGMELQTDQETIFAKPFYASDNPNDFGRLDLILFCCKTYSLETVARQFASTIHPGTILLPLLNGVDSTIILNTLYPQTKCLYGFAYLVSKITGPGIVQQRGKVNSIFFGHPDIPLAELEPIEKLFHAAGIQATLHPEILKKSWEKFCFIAPVATITSARDSSLGAILIHAQYRKELEQLIEEVIALARAKKISLSDSIYQDTIATAESLPFATTSSMQADFAAGKETEIETLTGYVVREAASLGIDAPVFSELYQLLKKK